MPSRKQAVSLFTFTVPNSANLSDIIHLQGLQPVSITTPATMQGTYLLFRCGELSTAMSNSYDMSGALVVAAMGASRTIHLDPIFFQNTAYFQLKTCSANDGTAQNQSQSTVFQIAAR